MTKLLVLYNKAPPLVTGEWQRLPSYAIKPSNCNNLRILLVYSRHTDSRTFRGHLRETYHQQKSSSTNIAARRFSCCAPTVWNNLPSFVRSADSFTSFRSHLKTICSQDICSRSTVHATDTLTESFTCYNSLLPYLLDFTSVREQM